MKTSLLFCLVLALASSVRAENVKRNIPYAEPANERQMLDVYAPDKARDLPVIFWIHGGGWQAGDKAAAHAKPKFFVEKGYVFVSTNYRLLPDVDMGTIVRDVAKSLHWVRDHIKQYGGDPDRIVVTGHSAGAQLAALICTDESYLKAEGIKLASIKGCVPVDGDTYDVPMMIQAGAAHRKSLGQPDPKFGHFEKFGSDAAKHRDFSAVNHVSRDKGIPPFLILYVADHPDTTAQAKRLGSVLTESGTSATLFGAKDSEHSKLNEDLGLPGDPATKAMMDFIGDVTKK
jgi:acetyl esterase/lipase